MAAVAETLLGKEVPKVKFYETRGWRPEESPPVFLKELASRIASPAVLSGSGEWKNVFIKAAIVDSKGIKQDIDSYLASGPSEKSPEFLILGLEFASPKAPLKLKLGQRPIDIRITINPFFSGEIKKREENEYFVSPNNELVDFLANSPDDAIRNGKPWWLYGLTVTDNPTMNIHTLPPDIKELARTQLDRALYRLYVHITLTDTFRHLKNVQENLTGERERFEQKLSSVVPRIRIVKA